MSSANQKNPRNPSFSYKYQKPSFQVPKKDWVHRNPRLFQAFAITGCLTVFFSRQIYDIFFRSAEDFLDPSLRPPANRR